MLLRKRNIVAFVSLWVWILPLSFSPPEGASENGRIHRVAHAPARVEGRTRDRNRAVRIRKKGGETSELQLQALCSHVPVRFFFSIYYLHIMAKKQKISDFFSSDSSTKPVKIAKYASNSDEFSTVAPILELGNNSKELVNNKIRSNSKVSESTIKKWKTEFPWIRIEESDKGTSIFCMVCRTCAPRGLGLSGTSFVKGTLNFKHETLNKHNESKVHKRACEMDIAIKNRSNCPLEKVIKKMPDAIHLKMNSLFNTAYMVAKEDYSITDFDKICMLQKKNGLSLGETYMNDKACKMFISYIAKDIHQEIKNDIQQSDFFSLMSDSSTDRSSTNSEIIYATFVKNGISKTRYLALVELENGTANSICDAIQQSLTLYDINWRNKLVATCFDGASVNMGHLQGVATLFKATCPGISSTHCIAHRLELVIKYAMEEIKLTQEVECILKGVYKLYHRSPTMLKGLQCIANILQEKLLKNTAVLKVRWTASKQRALKALINNYVPMVTHLEDFCNRKDSDKVAIAKVKGYLKSLKSLKFVRYICFLSDVIDVLTSLSLTFQLNDITTEKIVNSLERTTLELVYLKTNNGATLSDFESSFDAANNNYKSIYLKNAGQKSNIDLERDQVINHLITHIDDRFEDVFKNPIFKLSPKLFDPINLPNEENSLAAYGVHDLCTLFKKLPDCVNKKIDEKNLMNEYQLWKVWAKDKKTQSYNVLWNRLFAETNDCPRPDGENFSNLLIIISFLRALPFSTAICERGFSNLNVIKTDSRNRLDVSSLNDLMMIKINGASTDDYNSRNAIQLWFEDVAVGHCRRPEFLDE